jgi:hypothetical protein
VLDGGKRIIEVMQPPFPILILRRTTKSDRVRFERFPIHKQDVTIGYFDASLQLMRDVAWHRADDDDACRNAPSKAVVMPARTLSIATSRIIGNSALYAPKP